MMKSLNIPDDKAVALINLFARYTPQQLKNMQPYLEEKLAIQAREEEKMESWSLLRKHITHRLVKYIYITTLVCVLDMGERHLKHRKFAYSEQRLPWLYHLPSWIPFNHRLLRRVDSNLAVFYGASSCVGEWLAVV